MNHASTANAKRKGLYGPQFSWRHLQRWDQWPENPPTHWPDPALAGLEYFKPAHLKAPNGNGEHTEATNGIQQGHLARAKNMSKERWTNLVRGNEDPNEAPFIGTASMHNPAHLTYLGRTHREWCYRCSTPHPYHP